MGLYDEVVEVPRRTMVLFFVVDTSGSMSGAKIGTVNSAIEEVVPELKDISESNADAQIKVATLSFSTGARWIDSARIEKTANAVQLQFSGKTYTVLVPDGGIVSTLVSLINNT